MRVREVQLLGSKAEGGAPAQSQSSGYSSAPSNTVSSNASSVNDFTEPVDDLPF